LLKMGVVRGSLAELESRHVGALFMPHGLGHLLGLDTHDVGGWPAGSARPTEPGIRKLRSGRVLQEGMCITVEPGCYFIAELLLPAIEKTHSDLLVEDRVREMLGSGGVRIEDDVLVTKEGCRVLSDQLPRTVQEIETFMLQNNPHVKENTK
jgi:Xaa-Pro dipeptidase